MGQGTDFDVVVIGAGIVGLASAYKIALNHPDISIAVLEKEAELASHQTGHNSGVIHSGLYYKPGSAKARTCTQGRKQLVAFANKYKITHEICGKIIVATKEKELANLEMIFERSQQNGIEGIEKIGHGQIKEAEPFCAGIAGLRVPCTGIIDFVAVANKLAQLIEKQSQKNRILTSHKVVGFDKHGFFTEVVTNRGSVKGRFIINCAGLQSDRIARLDGVDTKMRIVPFRGDYYDLTGQALDKVRNLIYPVPDPAFPFLGVHFTRMTGGGVECGPNAVFSFKREGYRKTFFSLRDSWDSLTYWGTWKLFMRHWLYGMGEYARAFSKKLFVRGLRRLIPSIEAGDLRRGNSGVRAQALGPDGSLIDDFAIERKGNAIHVLNAPSPAATASLAIGEHISEMATECFKL